MPRPASRLVAKKQKHRSPVATPASARGPSVTYIIPGRLTEAQWTDALVQEEAEELVQEIMDELVDKVMENCQQVDVRNKLVPFTLSWTQSCLMRIVEQHYLCLDVGDGPGGTSATEDSEPAPTRADAWTPGRVPVVKASSQPPSWELTLEKTQKNQSHRPTKAVAQRRSCPDQPKKETSLQRPVVDYAVHTPRPPPRGGPKETQQVNSHRRRVPARLLPPLGCSAGRNDLPVERKSRTLSPLRQKDGSIPKLDPTRLPRHCINTQYEILDNSKTTTTTTTTRRPPATSEDQRRNRASVRSQKALPSKQEVLLLSGPLRLDSMQLAKGVSLLNPQEVDLNSVKSNPPAPSTKLKAILSQPAVPRYSIEEVIAGPPPQVTPLFPSKNVCS